MPDVLALQLVAAVDSIMKENTPESYRFVVMDQNGEVVGSGVGGTARSSIDPPSYQARLSDRLNICSMSKMVTAAAVLATLQAKNLSPDTLVAQFLPPDWKPSDEVKKLSFRDFMTHHSGFYWESGAGKPKQDGTSYDEIKGVLAQKPWFPIKSQYSYRNVNLALFRVVLPFLDAYDRYTKTVNMIGLNQTPEGLASKYIEVVNRLIMKPCGILNANCDSRTLSPPPSKNGRPAPIGSPVPVLAYHFKKPEQKGIDIGDRTLVSGAEGWCLSVTEVAKILQTLLYTEVIISEKTRAAMAVSEVGAGCGMNLDKLPKGSLVHSHGAWIPFEEGAPVDGAQLAGWFMCFDKAKLIVVTMSNSGHDPKIVASKGNWDARTSAAYEAIYA